MHQTQIRSTRKSCMYFTRIIFFFYFEDPEHSIKFESIQQFERKKQSKEKRHITLAKPSAVPVWVPKKMETLVLPAVTSTSSSSSSIGNPFGTNTGLTSLLRSEDFFQKNTRRPITTAAEVVAMRSSESDTESPSETPRSDSTVRTKSELEAIVSTARSNSE